LVAGEFAVTVKLPLAPAGIAAATLIAKGQLVAALTATVVDPVHSVAPAGGNASDGVADGVMVALWTWDGVLLPAVVDDFDPVAEVDFDGLVAVVGEPPPANQRAPPTIAAMTRIARRMITPREPEKLPRAGRCTGVTAKGGGGVGGGGTFGRSDGNRSASGVPGR
jgi:hypothetical protein